MFAIVQWVSFESVSIVSDDKGRPRLFLFQREAEAYPRENLSSKWQLIYLD